MTANERTYLLSAQENGNVNGVFKTIDKLIIPMPKDPIFVFEDYWGALSLQELLPFQDDPWWQRLRNIILYAFYFIVLLTFVTACSTAFAHNSSSACKITSSLIPMAATTTTTTVMSDVVTGKIAFAP